MDFAGICMYFTLFTMYLVDPQQAKNKHCVGLGDAAWLEPPTLRVSFFKSRRSRDGTCRARTTPPTIGPLSAYCKKQHVVKKDKSFQHGC